MILVLVGTNPYSFERLVRAADDYARTCSEPVFIQLGNTAYEPRYAQYTTFLTSQEVEQKIREASVVICQGGFGSIADSLREGKKVVAVPRKPELNEAPDRQEELVRELERLGLIIAVYEIDRLPQALEDAEKLDTTIQPNHKISALVNQFIERHS